MALNQLKQLSVEDTSLKLRCESIRSNSFQSYGVNQVLLQQVVQSGVITNTVNCNPNPSANVLIITKTSSIAGGSVESFIVNNSKIVAGSLVKATIIARAGGVNGANGIAVAQAHSISPNQVIVDICNCGNTAFTGSFEVLLEISDSVLNP